MAMTLRLPDPSGATATYQLTGSPIGGPAGKPKFSRVAYAAAHVVSDPFRERDPWTSPAIDWDATLQFRHHLRLGFKIAEAGTAQRGRE